MEMWELIARERIRDSLARYNWSGDSFRLDDLAATFCDDGVLEVRGREPCVGRAAIVRFLSGGAVGVTDDERRAARQAGDDGASAPTIVRHLVTNTRFVEVTRDQAHVESYFSVLTDIGLDHAGRYRDTWVPVEEAWLMRHRFVSTDWRANGSLMAGPADLPAETAGPPTRATRR